jgi:hypothetical protein
VGLTATGRQRLLQLVVEVNVTRLRSLAQYAVYCYAQPAALTASDSPTTFAQVATTRVAFNTTCCRQLSYLTRPTQVYTAPDAYKGGSPAQYMYTYALDTAPQAGTTVTVRPVLTALDKAGRGSLPYLMVVPVELTFGGVAGAGSGLGLAAGGLSGSFYLTNKV